ncbi:xylose repressor [Virgisporangium aliadipatigenens]|uniref:Xylose repressor n=1 Tax=Virgisporangium aliadipatigenens TaxID=741659 RepID=A0A8J3YR73_9ACTN|nr:ROK family transcriptional regulator [Virgisporangium aliadipatigenens]GIJ48381.1 xylose repressor [Virgisporangium aliadipatigenens]
MASASRWHAVAQVLAALLRRPDATRAEIARELGLTSGFATELTARMRELRLITEVRAPVHGRGRPTTVLAPHPEGPVVLAVELRHADYAVSVATVDGRLHGTRRRPHRQRRPEAVVQALRRTVGRARDRYGHRLRAVSIAVAATVHDGRVVQASTLGWGEVDLTAVLQDPPAGVRDLAFLVGNDATLAGVAEARTGAATGAGTALHLIVEVGIGGCLTVDGFPLTGAHGAAGEYGHLPFGSRGRRCPCGARGCWDLDVDGRALARHLGEPSPADPYGYAVEVLRRAADDVRARRAVGAVARALAGGIAGLVNVHDPGVVTLGGLGPAIRLGAAEAFARAYADGLIAYRRVAPPPVVDAAHAEWGPLRGAAIVGLDRALGEEFLGAWAAR